MMISQLKTLINYINFEIKKFIINSITPLEYGPRLAEILRRIVGKLLIISLLLSMVSPAAFILKYPYNLLLPVIPIIIIIIIYIIPRMWRVVLSSGVDRELPSLLAYALPYSAGPKYLADVLVNAPSKYFPWFKWEAERLRFLNDSGLDPISSLKKLAETTPSRKLRDILTDYIHSYELGSPRSQVTLRLLEKAVIEARSQWRSYMELGKGTIEALTALVLAVVVIAPLSFLSSNSSPVVALMPALITPLTTTLMVILRPEIGDLELGMSHVTIAFTMALISGIICYLISPITAIGLLALGAVTYELLYKRYRDEEDRAMAALREVAVSARYGRFIEEDLTRAMPVASKAIGALLAALSYAGKLGVGEAITSILRIVEEARESIMTARGQGLILAAVASAAPVVSVYIIETIVNIASGVPQFNVDIVSIKLLENVIIALAPLIPLPATILWRGKIPSLIPSLLSLLASTIVLLH